MRYRFVLTLLALVPLAAEDQSTRRVNLRRLHDDLQSAIQHANLDERDLSAAKDAVYTLDNITRPNRRESRQDREQITDVAETVEQLLDRGGLAAADRTALRHDLQILQGNTGESHNLQPDVSRRRLRDAIKPSLEDASTYPASADSLPTGASPADNRAYGGWRRVPLQ